MIMKKGISIFQGLALLAMMTMSSAMTVSLTSCSNEDNIGDIPSKLDKAPIAKAAINDIVFGRTPWFSAKFQSDEYENALKESPFVYPKN